MPLDRVARLKFESLADDDLVQLYRRAVLVGARAATARLAREAVARPSVAGSIPPADAYRRLIAAEDDDTQALALIDEARQRSEATGESTAPWDLAELEIHIDNGNAEQAQQMLQRIERLHMNDPQVAAAVYRLLYETGVISPERAASQQPIDEGFPVMATSGQESM